jgi:hypothetical protein
MKLSHEGMRISEGDWMILLNHADATLKAFNVPQAEYDQVVAFVQSTKVTHVQVGLIALALVPHSLHKTFRTIARNAGDALKHA